MNALRHLARRFRRFSRAALLLGIPALAFLTYAMLIEPRMIEVTHRDIGIRDLPQEFDGFRIVQLSDIHVGAWVSNDDVRRFVALVNAQKPDAVVITGDFLTRLTKDIPGIGKALSGLKAKHGVYAVLGNHDYWEDEDAITRALLDNGIEVLFDESRDIERGGAGIRIVGTDDAWEGAPDYEKAFEGIEEGDACIVLAHNPDAARRMDARLADLVLSGHTHGGLIVIPGVGALLSSSGLGRKVVSGMHEVNGIPVYINRGVGTGTTLIPVRFRCRPEIAVFTLHSPK